MSVDEYIAEYEYLSKKVFSVQGFKPRSGTQERY